MQVGDSVDITVTAKSHIKYETVSAGTICSVQSLDKQGRSARVYAHQAGCDTLYAYGSYTIGISAFGTGHTIPIFVTDTTAQ